MKIVFTFIVYVILPIVLVSNFINQFYFPFFFLIDHGNEYDTIKYKYQIKMKNFQPKIIFLGTITYTLIMPMLNIYHMRGG